MELCVCVGTCRCLVLRTCVYLDGCLLMCVWVFVCLCCSVCRPLSFPSVLLMVGTTLQSQHHSGRETSCHQLTNMLACTISTWLERWQPQLQGLITTHWISTVSTWQLLWWCWACNLTQDMHLRAPWQSMRTRTTWIVSFQEDNMCTREGS